MATDIRLYVRDEIDAILELLQKLQKVFWGLAAKTPTRLCRALHTYKLHSQ